MLNIIRINEGGVSIPYVVHQRVSEFAQINLKNGYRLIREQRRDGASLLICEPIKDAEWSDI